LDKLIHPEAYLQRPGILIIVSPDAVKDGKVDYTLDADTVEISGVRMGKLLGKAESWRVNLFQNGNRVSGIDDFEDNRNNRIIELPGVPVEKLLRADLDLHLRGTLGKEDAECRTESFMVLFHQYPEAKQLR